MSFEVFAVVMLRVEVFWVFYKSVVIPVSYKWQWSDINLS